MSGLGRTYAHWSKTPPELPHGRACSQDRELCRQPLQIRPGRRVVVQVQGDDVHFGRRQGLWICPLSVQPLLTDTYMFGPDVQSSQNYPKFSGQAAHVLQVRPGQSLHVRELGSQVFGQSPDDPTSPPFSCLVFQDGLADRPVQSSELGVDGPDWRRPCPGRVAGDLVRIGVRSSSYQHRSRPGKATALTSGSSRCSTPKPTTYGSPLAQPSPPCARSAVSDDSDRAAVSSRFGTASFCRAAFATKAASSSAVAHTSRRFFVRDPGYLGAVNASCVVAQLSREGTYTEKIGIQSVRQ
jgi:hypothetical protein